MILYSNKDVGHEVGNGKVKSAPIVCKAEIMIARFFSQKAFQTPLDQFPVCSQTMPKLTC